LNPLITEVTTGATDALLGLETIACAIMLWGSLSTDRYKIRLWLGAFGLLVVASALGALTHGFDISEGLRHRLWQPLFLSLGLMLGLIAVAAMYDRWGPPVARRALPLAIIAGLGFYGITLAAEGVFLVFVAYESVAIAFALVVYSQLAARHHPGAVFVAAGVSVTLCAAIAQQTDWTVTLIWPLDHNGIFHLIQMPGLLLITLGVRRSFGTPAHQEKRGAG
jgi:hypothetical protein